MNLHDQILNLPTECDSRDSGQFAYGYKNGHKSARHAAAELALVADAEIARLQSAWDSAHAQAMQNGERANALRDECDRLREDAERHRKGVAMTGLQAAILFHDTYERLAPQFGYETRPDTKKFDPESANGRLMIAVCGAVLTDAAMTPPTQGD